jgi:hypothetical protein
MKSKIENRGSKIAGLLCVLGVLCGALFSGSAFAAKTLVGSRLEMMDGAINSDAFPTMTTTTAGTCVVHRGGSRTAAGIAAPGRCGVMKAALLERSWTMAATGIQTEEGWIRIRKLGTTSAGGMNFMIGARRGLEQSFVFGHHGDGEIVIDDAFIGRTNTGFILSPGTWYYVVLTCQLTAGPTLTDIRLEIKPLGGNFSTLYNRSGLSIAFASPIFQVFNNDNQNNSRWSGHVAAWGQYSLGALGDSQTMPANVIDPASGTSWWATAAGVSNNDGSAASPFALSVATINDELLNGVGPGDFLTIDNSTGVWDMGANALVMDTSGASDVSVQFLGPRANRKLHKDITAATWANVSGAIWSTTDGAATDLVKIIVWQDDVAMTHPVGANFAAVTAALTAAPGFWTDGTTIYVHATGNGNPGSNGHVYVRSRDRVIAGTHQQTAMQITNCKNLRIYNWGSQYVGYVDPADNNGAVFIGSLALVDVGCSGFIECYDFDGDWTGRHFGSAVLSGPMTVRWIRPRVGRGHPYGGYGTNSSFADQVNDNTTTARTEYIQPRSVAGADAVFWTCHGVPGSASGRVASTLFDRLEIAGDISNQDGTDGVAGRCVLVTVNRGRMGALTNATGMTMNVDTASVTGTKTLTTAVAGTMWADGVSGRVAVDVGIGD